MKKSILFICILLAFAIQAEARGIVMAGGNVVSAAPACSDSSCTGFLICQNFEGSGYDNSESYTEDNGGCDEDYTTSPLRGSQSMMCLSNQSYREVVSPTFSNTSEVWGHFLFSTSAITSDAYIFRIRNGTTDLMTIRPTGTDGTIRVGCGDNGSNSASGILLTNTAQHIWFRVKAGTGANGECDLWVGTSTTRPATRDIAATNGNNTASANNLKIIVYNTNGNYKYDQILVDDASIGSVCD